MKFTAMVIFGALAGWCGSSAILALREHHPWTATAWIIGTVVSFGLACWMGSDEDDHKIDY